MSENNIFGLYKVSKNIKDRLITWEQHYDLAKAYYEKNNDLLIPENYKTINGYEYNENGINLGKWNQVQRRNYDKLPEFKKEKLEQIGFIKNVYDEQWEKNYKLAKKYYEQNNDLLIPQNFKTENGYEFNEKGVNLGNWNSTQRHNYDKLSQEKKEKLQKIGFVKSPYDVQWLEKYKLAKIYYEHHHNLLIPAHFKTISGYEFDEKGVSLGRWNIHQRDEYENLSQEKKEKLSQIGFVKNFKTTKWENYYELAKIYYEHHHNLLMPEHFKTTNGYEFDEEGIKLGNWITEQRLNYDKLSPEKKDLLEKIEFIKSLRENRWDQNYKLAKAYYEHHNDLLIPRYFKTINGYEPNENGINIGNWNKVQRENYDKLSNDRKLKLDQIGMIWNIRQNKDLIEELCIKYNIDVEINKNVLKHISYKELNTKILYLLDNESSIVSSNGKLHEIFSMSNLHMKAKYNISLEELLNQYQTIKKEK